MITTVEIILLMVLQVFLLIRGIFRIKKYVFDLCGYVDVLFFLFFSIPAWDLYWDTNIFDHRAVDYGISPNQTVILYYIFVTTFIALLFDMGYQLGTGKILNLSDNRRLVDICNDTVYKPNTYKLMVFVLTIFWLATMFYAYRAFGKSLILFLLPSRKQDVYSGFISLMQLLVPDIIFSLSIIRNWDRNKVVGPSLIPLLMVLITVSSNNQRREMIQGIVFCGLLLLIKYFKLLKGRNGIEVFLQRKPWKKYIIAGIVIAVVLIPLLWYARSFSNQLVRGGVTVNPFSLHSFTDLLFGSSTTGFDTTLVIDQYDNTYGGLFFHCIRFFVTFWIPRSIYPGKLMQITQMIKVSRGDWGNLSTFYVNDLYFSFKWLSVIFVPLGGIMLSRIYNKASISKKLEDTIFSVYMFSQLILLFKNGISVFWIRVVLFWIVFKFVNFCCKHVKIGY